MKFIPNKILPKGAKLFKRLRTKRAGSWSERLSYDASVKRLGLTWLRVHGGFSQKFDREDWVADLPSGCLCVSDYDWRNVGFGLGLKTFDAAILTKTNAHLNHAEAALLKAEKNIEALRGAAKVVRSAVAKVCKSE